MGTYNISAKELMDDFEDFLHEQEGDISALTISECWNKLAKKNKWEDNLIAINKFTKKPMED